MELENIKKAEKFYGTLTVNQMNKLYSYYENFILNTTDFIPFINWLADYMDLPNILKTMYL